MRLALILLTFFSLSSAPSTLAAESLASRVSGRILLAVEQHGEAWYVDPINRERSYLGRPHDALAIMQSYGLGITDTDLMKIPVAASGAVGDPALRRRLAGRILLQVQSHGEAWYVDPVSLRRVSLGGPAEAFIIMRQYGLGISNRDLEAIPTTPTEARALTAANTVPFITQAPLENWADPRQQDGCEEASALMAVAWSTNQHLSATTAEQQIIAMSDWEEDQFGYFQDTGIHDTADHLLNSYLHFTKYEIYTDADLQDLITVLQAGSIAIFPINGQTFSPFHYLPPGPARHMIVVHGYNADTGTFLVHDPGTAHGSDLQVTSAALEKSWRDYASGEQMPIPDLPRSFIRIER